MASNPVLAEITRGDQLESRHRGAAVVVEASGQVLHSWGDIEALTFPRSSLKPFQALPLVADGAADQAQLTEAEIALACGSHSGEPRHVEAIQAWLNRLSLSPEALTCGVHPPVNEQAAKALFQSGEEATCLHHNCSGKHAGVLTWIHQSKETKLDPSLAYSDWSHPIQARVRQALSDLSGLAIDEAPYGLDGCGLPAYAMPLRSLAHCAARLADPDNTPEPWGSAGRQILAAMRAHPGLIAGEGRFDTQIMDACPEVVSKGGAEGVEIAFLPTKGLGIAVKIDDGALRAAEVVMAAILDGLGINGAKALSDLPVPAIGGVEPGAEAGRRRALEYLFALSG